MRFEQLELQSFGTLSGRVFDLSADAIVVYGPNEAGKSTLHSALQTVLFGFEEARRERHPLGEWNPTGSDLSLTAQLRMDSEVSFWLRRELRTASGILQRASQRSDLDRQARSKDEPLLEVQAVSRELFRAVYSLGANGTLELRDNVRHQVDNLLAGDVGLPGARPFYEVQAELRQAANQLWRADGRRTAARTQAQAIQELRRERRHSMAMDLERRTEQRELDELGAALGASQVAIAETREGLARAQFHAQWQAWEARKKQCVDLHASALEGEALEDPVRLQQEIDQLEQDLQGPRARLARPALALDGVQRSLLKRESDIRAARDQQPLAQVDAERQAEAQRRHRVHGEQARRDLQDADLAHLDPGQLDELPLGGWAAEARAWQDAQEQARQTQMYTAPKGPDRLAVALIGLGLVSAGLHAAHALPVAALWVGLGALAMAFVATWSDRRPRRSVVPSTDQAPLVLQEACAHLDVDPYVSPHRLLRQIEGASDAREAWDLASEAELAATECGERLQARLEIWSKLAIELLPLQTVLDPQRIPSQLSEALEEAASMRERALADELERTAESARLEERSARLGAAQERLERARRALEESFGTDLPIEAAFRAWKDQLDLHAFVREAEQGLQRHPLFEGHHQAPIHGDPAPVWEQRLRELEDQEKQLLTRRERLSERHAHRSTRSMAMIDAELTEAEEELASIHLRHDRLTLLDRLLTKAEQNYRREHQPDVLRRAAGYLSLISAGRYTELSYPHGDDGPLHVFSASEGRDLAVRDPLSRGTQEQIYLALRLGTLDHLDAGRVRLPLILDEVLVHWDRARREALYPVLAEIAPQRQVILLTCHPEFAAEAQLGIGAARIELAPQE